MIASVWGLGPIPTPDCEHCGAPVGDEGIWRCAWEEGKLVRATLLCWGCSLHEDRVQKQSTAMGIAAILAAVGLIATVALLFFKGGR